MSMDAYDLMGHPDSSSNCCGGRVDMFGLCSQCGEHCEDEADYEELLPTMTRMSWPLPEVGASWNTITFYRTPHFGKSFQTRILKHTAVLTAYGTWGAESYVATIHRCGRNRFTFRTTKP